MTPTQLEACLGCKPATASKWAGHLSNTMDCFGIDNPLRQSAFLAQVGHESGLLRLTEENLNYDADGLLRVFGKYFDTLRAKEYARNPERIANRVYANRMGNGPEETGDGWRYHGRGLIQTTGKNNYKNAGLALGLDLIIQPELLLVEENTAMSAGVFWDSRHLNALADAGQFEQITRAVNGGLNGQADRLKLYEQAKVALGA